MKVLMPFLALAAASLVLHLPAEAQGGPGKGKAAVKAGPFKRRADGKPDLSGYWDTKVFATAFSLEAQKQSFEIPENPGVVVDPPDGKIPYLPEAMKHKLEMESRLAEDPQGHCFLSGVPRQMYTPFGFQILQARGGNFLLNFEAFHAYRMIHMGGKHPDPAIKLFEGDSRGHWEGDTLVVDVTNMNDRTWFDMAANFHSDQLHVVERYTPVDANTIRYEATLTDPKTFSRPFKIRFDLGRNPEPDYEILEYACVEGEQDLQHYTVSAGGAKEDK